MKLGKLSLVAVMALGTSAFAIENTKVAGEAKVIYQTTERGAQDLFDYDTNSLAGIGLRVGATTDLVKGFSAGVEAQAFTTLGLENNLVKGVMATDSTDDQWQFSQIWIATTMGNTTAKLGRMELDTPLAFTEKWNVVNNTFDAAVVLNNDLPDTTLVAAWVGKDNGMGGDGLLISSNGKTADMNSNFGTFMASGAYAVAAINKSLPGTTLQGWYYNVLDVADAFWLQADSKVAMVNVGAQYANMNPKADGLETSSIWAVKASADVSGVNVYAAYSSADNDGVLGFANTATGDKTKIYTGLGSIYMDGIVTRPGADTYKVGASTTAAGIKLAASYTDSDADAGNEISAWDVSASGALGPVGLQAIYTSVSNDSALYSGMDLDTLRIIASLKF